MKRITPKQQAVLIFLKDYHKENGFMPSSRDIQMHFGFHSQTAAIGHLNALARKGYIKRHANMARAITIINRDK